MVFSLLSSFTPMIKRLIYLPNLLTVNVSNSFIKTLVLSPWDDPSPSSSPPKYLHLVFMLCLTCFCLFIFSFCFFFFFCIWYKNKKSKIEKSKKYKNSVCCVYIGTCVPWMAIETKFSKLCILCSLDEHLYAQLSKWALWLLFVMSKIELSLVLNTRINLFDGNE